MGAIHFPRGIPLKCEPGWIIHTISRQLQHQAPHRANAGCQQSGSGDGTVHRLEHDVRVVFGHSEILRDSPSQVLKGLGRLASEEIHVAAVEPGRLVSLVLKG